MTNTPTVTRKLALDLIADAIAGHILAQIARDQTVTPQAEPPTTPAARQPVQRAAKNKKAAGA